MEGKRNKVMSDEDFDEFDEDELLEDYDEEEFEDLIYEEAPVDKKKKKKEDRPHYIDSKLFLKQIEDYYETGELKAELTDNLRKIAEGLSYNWRFIEYTWKSEMVGDAYLKMLGALISKNFDVSKKFSPFSYFNKIAWTAFTTRIKKENKQHERLQEYKQRVYEDLMSNGVGGYVYVKPVMEADENDGCYDD